MTRSSAHSELFPLSTNDNWVFLRLNLSHLSLIQVLIWVLPWKGKDRSAPGLVEMKDRSVCHVHVDCHPDCLQNSRAKTLLCLPVVVCNGNEQSILYATRSGFYHFSTGKHWGSLGSPTLVTNHSSFGSSKTQAWEKMYTLVLTGEWELQTATSLFPLLRSINEWGKKKNISGRKTECFILSFFFLNCLSPLR